MGLSNDDRLRVTYRLTDIAGQEPGTVAQEIAHEQTVELPPDCVGDAITDAVVGRVEAIESLSGGGGAVISYAPELIGDDAAQLANLLFGNISLKHGILITAIDWPQALIDAFGGARYGIAGLRALTAAQIASATPACLKYEVCTS